MGAFLYKRTCVLNDLWSALYTDSTWLKEPSAFLHKPDVVLHSIRSRSATLEPFLYKSVLWIVVRAAILYEPGSG